MSGSIVSGEIWPRDKLNTVLYSKSRRLSCAP